MTSYSVRRLRGRGGARACQACVTCPPRAGTENAERRGCLGGGAACVGRSEESSVGFRGCALDRGPYLGVPGIARHFDTRSSRRGLIAFPSAWRRRRARVSALVGSAMRLAFSLGFLCVGALVFTLAGCPAGADVTPAIVDYDPSLAAIVGGRPAPELGALVQVVGPRGVCSGTVVSPCVVVTAKHCVQAPGAADADAVGELFVIEEPETSQESESTIRRQLRVRSVLTPPGAYTTEPLRFSGIVGGDVAALVLADNAESTPVSLAGSFSPEWLGQVVIAAGYGFVPEGLAGERRAARRRLLRRLSSVAFTESAICEGDSGGPLFSPEGALFAVASFGQTFCGEGLSGYTLIAPFRELIERAQRMCEPCQIGGCQGDGTACAASEACRSGVCGSARASEQKTCLASCARRDDVCPEGTRCLSLASPSCERACVATGVEPSAAVGEICLVSEACASGLCMEGRCRQPCQVDAGLCSEGEGCHETSTCAFCAPLSDLAAAGLGEGCQRDEDCREGRPCHADGRRRFCSLRCTSDNACGAGFRCVQGLCEPGERQGLGGSCRRTQDCTANLECLWPVTREGLGLGLCSRNCDRDNPCPTGVPCRRLAEGDFCLAEGLPLGARCQADLDCTSIFCAKGLCTLPCPEQEPCPPGFFCRDVDEAGTRMCTLPNAMSAGCGVGGDALGNWWGLLLLCLMRSAVPGFRRKIGLRLRAPQRGVDGAP